MRCTPLRRATALRRGAPVRTRPDSLDAERKWLRTRKRLTAAEKAEKFAREFGSKERVAWIAAHGCVGCGRTPCENHHTRNGGQGRRADACWIVPLCTACHWWVHNRGAKTFEAMKADTLCGFTLREWAHKYDVAWRLWEEECRA